MAQHFSKKPVSLPHFRPNVTFARVALSRITLIHVNYNFSFLTSQGFVIQYCFRLLIRFSLQEFAKNHNTRRIRRQSRLKTDLVLSLLYNTDALLQTNSVRLCLSSSQFCQTHISYIAHIIFFKTDPELLMSMRPQFPRITRYHFALEYMVWSKTHLKLEK